MGCDIIAERTETSEASLACQFANAEGLARVLHIDILWNVEGTVFGTIVGVERETTVGCNGGMWNDGALEGCEVELERGAGGYPS